MREHTVWKILGTTALCYSISSLVLVWVWLLVPKAGGLNLGHLHIAVMVMALVLSLWNHAFPFRAGMTKKQLWGKRLVALLIADISFTLPAGLLGVISMRLGYLVASFVLGGILAALFYIWVDHREKKAIAEINKQLEAWER